MFAVTMWKEYREQRATWVALAALTVAVTIVFPAVFPPEGGQAKTYNELLSAVAVILAWAYGIVCGGMLLAGEREAGTQTYLDTLPAARYSLWKAKLVAGLPFVLANWVAVSACLVLGGLVE